MNVKKIIKAPFTPHRWRVLGLGLAMVTVGGCGEPRTPEQLRTGYIADVNFYRERLVHCEEICPAATVTLDLEAKIPDELEELLKFRNQHIKHTRHCFRNCNSQKDSAGVDPMDPLILGGIFIAADELMD